MEDRIELSYIVQIPPRIFTETICVTDDPIWAAVISSYFQKTSEYFVVLQMSTLKDPPTNVVGRIHLNFIEVHLNNRIQELKPKRIIFGGLNEFQKSCLRISSESVIDLTDLEQIEAQLAGITEASNGILLCPSKHLARSLYIAKCKNLRLKIDEDAELDECIVETHGGVFVLEDEMDVPAICTVNLAVAYNADLQVIPKVDSKEAYRIKMEIETAGNGIDLSGNPVERSRLDEVVKTIRGSISTIDFTSYSWATFLTVGIPYSLVLNDKLPTSLLLRNSASLGIFDSLYKDQYSDYFYSAFIFSVPINKTSDTTTLEESQQIAELFDEQGYHVVLLEGKNATKRNFGKFVPYFPYDVLHIGSHGGGSDGEYHQVKLTDEDGITHVFDYYQVLDFELVGKSPETNEPMVGVTGMLVPITLDGSPFGSSEYTKQAVQAVEKYITETHLGERKSDITLPFKGRIPHSRFIQCVDNIHQGQFQILACQTAPFIFNNSCCSWFDLGTAFLGIGASAYIGTLWNIGTDTAKECAEFFYQDCLSNDRTIMESCHLMNKKISNPQYFNCYVYWGLPWSNIPKAHDPRALIFLEMVNYLKRFLVTFSKHHDGELSDSLKQQEREAIDYISQTIKALPEIYWRRFS